MFYSIRVLLELDKRRKQSVPAPDGLVLTSTTVLYLVHRNVHLSHTVATVTKLWTWTRLVPNTYI